MCERTLTSDVNKLSPPSLSGENVSDVNLDRTFPTGRCMHLLLNLIDREVGVAFLLSLGGRYKLFIDATILDHVRVRCSKTESVCGGARRRSVCAEINAERSVVRNAERNAE